MADQKLQTATTDHGHFPMDLKSRVTTARRGVSVAEAVEIMQRWSVPVARFAAVLGCSERTWARVRGGSPDDLLPVTTSDRLRRALRILTHARIVFDDEADARVWMAAPNAALGGESPLSLLDTDEGVRLVDEVLTRLQFGVYA